MASSTKKALADALKKMMAVKAIDRITVNDLVTSCGVSRQTFYYHFNDVYDLLEWVFEEDANANLPREVVYDNWQHDVTLWFRYLYDNSAFALNVYNSNSRLYMLRYIQGRLRACIRSFSEIVAEGRELDRQDFEFIVEFYSNLVVGLIAQWMDQGMTLPKEITTDRVLRVLDNSIENIMARFEKKPGEKA